ncbi:MAG TPA: sterol desaturase family protein [Xanthomonadales bacterium]|nr:sterol desaturase family protein [Xanthomonadales bacterium]
MAATIERETTNPGADAPVVPARVAAFRDEYRAAEIPASYKPWLHVAITFGGASAAFAACLLMLDDVQPLEWLAVPATFLYANLVEYLGHRWPMHRPWPLLRLVYKRHAGQHHRFFEHDAMALESTRDLRAVLFPPILVLFFFGVFGAPLWWIVRLVFSANVAWLLLATALGYFLNYEILHLAHHATPAWQRRLPFLARLARRHRAHHDPTLMTKRHFNITYPIGDWLFGTGDRKDRPA